MKNKKRLKLIFKLTALALLCAGLALSIRQEEWIWTFSLAAGLSYEMGKLK